MGRRSNFLLIGLLFLTSCSSYKSTWDCPKESGIGCSSIEYADEIAKDQIMLNQEGSKGILLDQVELLDERYRQTILG